MLNKLKRDYERNEKKLPVLLILFLYRLGNYIYYKNIYDPLKKTLLLIIKLIYIPIQILYSVEIPFAAQIGAGIRFRHPNGIMINENCTIGDDCTIFHQVTIGASEKYGNIAARIGNDVYIGCGAKIIGNITIEDNVKIGANAVVVNDVPKDSTVFCQQIVKLSNINKLQSELL